MSSKRPGSALKQVLPSIKPPQQQRPEEEEENNAIAAASAAMGETSALNDRERDALRQMCNTLSVADDLAASPEKYRDIIREMFKHTCSSLRSVDQRIFAGRLFVNNGICEITKKFWDSMSVTSPGDWQKYKNITVPQVTNFCVLLSILLNITDTGDSDIITKVNVELMSFIMRLLASDTFSQATGSRSHSAAAGPLLGIIYNCVHKMEGTRSLIRSMDGVAVLSIYSQCNDVSMKTDAIIILSYIVTEKEQQLLLGATYDNIVYIVRVLTDCLRDEKNHLSAEYGYTATEILDGINRMAIADSNKQTILSCGALPLYEAFLKESCSEEENALACRGLWTLAFDEANKAKILSSSRSMEGLRRLASSQSEQVSKAAKGALWVIEGQQQRVQQMSSALTSPNAKGKHIMLSYNWGVKPGVLRVRDHLRAAGYSVWIDVEHMSGSTLEAMSKAIEDASVVLLFFTEKYKLSDSCRLEAEYLYKLRKAFIPIKMEANYKPDGWLGILIGTKLFFDFTKEAQWSDVFEGLCAELSRHLSQGSWSDAVLDNVNGPAISAVHQPPLLANPASVHFNTSHGPRQCLQWHSEDVQKWLQDSGLESCCMSFSKFKGKHVLELHHMMKTAPEFFYRKMTEEPFHLEFFDLLNMASALRELT